LGERGCSGTERTAGKLGNAGVMLGGVLSVRSFLESFDNFCSGPTEYGLVRLLPSSI
jgi:hypothetical protein